MTTYYSPGKILLLGEYLVLKGAKAVAFPTFRGQSLSVHPLMGSDSEFMWTALNCKGELWFGGLFQVKENRLVVKDSSHQMLAESLEQILNSLLELRPAFIEEMKGSQVVTRLEFEEEYGLGSSSTLIQNLSLWAKVDAHQLLQKTFKGSGYDLAVAEKKRPIIFHKGKTSAFKCPFLLQAQNRQHLFVVPLGCKVSSSLSVENLKGFLGKAEIKESVEVANDLVDELTKVENLNDWNAILKEYEELLVKDLHLVRAKTLLFNDFFGEIKSLGAWGGDLILASTESDEWEVKKYFSDKGFKDVMLFEDLVDLNLTPKELRGEV